MTTPLDLSNREDKMARRRRNTRCDFCRPNRGENAKHKGRYGSRPPREKNRRPSEHS